MEAPFKDWYVSASYFDQDREYRVVKIRFPAEETSITKMLYEQLKDTTLAKKLTPSLRNFLGLSEDWDYHGTLHKTNEFVVFRKKEEVISEDGK